MLRYFALAACLITSPTLARAAEPVETAIAEWIAAINAAPGWSAKVGSVTYSGANATAVVDNLTVSNADIDLVLEFQPISISDYVEAADGTFDAGSVVSDGLTATGNGFEAAVSGVRYEGLENFARNMGELVSWDPERPFTSMIQAYGRLLDIRLARSTIDAVSMTVEHQGEKIDISYEDVSLEDWADGRIGRVAIGPMAIAGAGIEAPFTVGIEGSEARGIDYSSILHIYDPDRYVGGVGDGIWRNAIEFLRYDTIAFETPDVEIVFGELTAEDYRVRQPERSFAELFDKAMLEPGVEYEPTAEELPALLGSISSFAIGTISLSEITVSAQDGGDGRLDGIRFLDVSAEGIEEFSFDGFEMSAPDGGNVDVGHLSFGGLVFPPLTALLEAAEAEEAGKEFDYSKLATQLAFFEARGIDVDIPQSPRFSLDTARLDLGNYVGTIPTFVAFNVAGADFPASVIEDPTAKAMWEALGYDRIRGGMGAQMAWSEDNERVTIEDFRFSIDDVGALSFSAVLEGISLEALVDHDRMPEMMAGVSFVRGALTLDNYDVLDRWIDQQAEMSGNEPAALRQQVAGMLAEVVSGVGDTDFQAQVRRVLEASVMTPGSITVSAQPSAPVPLVALGVLAQTAPANLPNLLGITVDRTPGKSP